ncbi:MAG: hypothetical protein C0490_14675 [Marivirga sp.]|nr:hypothetical protein [Marivirga sp.]
MNDLIFNVPSEFKLSREDRLQRICLLLETISTDHNVQALISEDPLVAKVFCKFSAYGTFLFGLGLPVCLQTGRHWDSDSVLTMQTAMACGGASCLANEVIGLSPRVLMQLNAVLERIALNELSQLDMTPNYINVVEKGFSSQIAFYENEKRFSHEKIFGSNTLLPYVRFSSRKMHSLIGIATALYSSTGQGNSRAALSAFSALLGSVQLLDDARDLHLDLISNDFNSIISLIRSNSMRYVRSGINVIAGMDDPDDVVDKKIVMFVYAQIRSVYSRNYIRIQGLQGYPQCFLTEYYNQIWGILQGVISDTNFPRLVNLVSAHVAFDEIIGTLESRRL